MDAEPESAIDALRRGDVDLALVFNYNVQEIVNADGIELVEILVEPIRAVVASNHRLAASQAPIELAELAQEPWIQCNSPNCRLLLERAAREAGFAPAVAFRTDDYPTAIALVDAGVGVALLPAIALRALPAGVRALPLASPLLTRHVLAAVPPGPQRSPAADAMLEMLARAASGYAASFARERIRSVA